MTPEEFQTALREEVAIALPEVSVEYRSPHDFADIDETEFPRGMGSVVVRGQIDGESRGLHLPVSMQHIESLDRSGAIAFAEYVKSKWEAL